MELMKRRRNIINAPHIEKAEGNILSFNTNMTGILKACNVKIKPVQDLHGQEYPYPPGGSTNLFDKDNTTVYARAMNTVSGKWISYNAKSYAFPCKPDTDYVVTAVRSGLPLLRIAYITESPIPESADVNIYNVQQRSSEGSLCIHTGADATYIIMQPTGSYADSTKIQVEEGSIPTQYHPFSNICPINGWTGVELNHTGTLFEISFPDANTIYGGTLDLLTGVLTVTHYLFTIDKNTYFVFGQGFNSYYRAVYYLPENGKMKQFSNCNMFKFREYSSTAMYYPEKEKLSAYPADSETTQAVFGLPDGITSADEWRSFIETNGDIQIVYELATTHTIQLTPIQLKAIVGANNILANTGETYVEYWIH